MRAWRLRRGRILANPTGRWWSTAAVYPPGFDLRMLQAVTATVSIPVIASGGAGSLAHFYDALTVGGAEAALAASLFHYNTLTIGQVKAYLRQRGVAVR